MPLQQRSIFGAAVQAQAQLGMKPSFHTNPPMGLPQQQFQKPSAPSDGRTPTKPTRPSHIPTEKEGADIGGGHVRPGDEKWRKCAELVR